MSAIAVDVSGVKAGLNQLAIDLQGAAWDALAKTLEAAEKVARQSIQASTRTRTGTLLRSFDRFREPAGLRGHLVNRADYAVYVNDGTRPHTIRARNAQFLRFTVNGTTMYRRAVQHPGTAPRPFVPIASAVGLQVLSDSLKIGVAKAADRFNR